MTVVPLALLLLRASRWFDRQLLEGLHDSGWPMLTAAQSLVFAHLEPDGVPPAELARRLGSTRQATHQLVTGLVALELLALRPNPARRGGRLVTLTAQGRALTHDAHHLLAAMEDDLGADRIAQLRAALSVFTQPEHILGGSQTRVGSLLGNRVQAAPSVSPVGD